MLYNNSNNNSMLSRGLFLILTRPSAYNSFKERNINSARFVIVLTHCYNSMLLLTELQLHEHNFIAQVKLCANKSTEMRIGHV